MKISRFIGAALSAVMAVCCMIGINNSFSTDVTVYAEEVDGFVIKTDADGDKYISGYKGSGGDIVIPSDVVWIGEKAFADNTSIKSVTIPKTCWYWIDNSAFRNCTKLKTVTFEGNIEGIGENVFNGCTSLKSVIFEGDVGRKDGSGGIGYRAFYGCTSLELVSFSKNSSKLDMIGEFAFMNCSSLSVVRLPTGLKVVYSGAFVNCRSLDTISVPADTKLDGKHIFGYMYGSLEQGGKKGYVVADGKRKLYIGDAEKSTSQKVLTMVLSEGSAAEKYAKRSGINYIYRVTLE